MGAAVEIGAGTLRESARGCGKAGRCRRRAGRWMVEGGEGVRMPPPGDKGGAWASLEAAAGRSRWPVEPAAMRRGGRGGGEVERGGELTGPQDARRDAEAAAPPSHAPADGSRPHGKAQGAAGPTVARAGRPGTGGDGLAVGIVGLADRSPPSLSPPTPGRPFAEVERGAAGGGFPPTFSTYPFHLFSGMAAGGG